MELFGSCCENRDLKNPDMQRGERPPTDDMEPRAVCGVGINFRADKTGALFVSSLIPDGPSDQTKQVEVGDVLFEVDGRPVHRASLGHVSSHLLGPPDSKVVVCFLRKGEMVNVTIARKPIPNLMSVNRLNKSAAE